MTAMIDDLLSGERQSSIAAILAILTIREVSCRNSLAAYQEFTKKRLRPCCGPVSARHPARDGEKVGNFERFDQAHYFGGVHKDPHICVGNVGKHQNCS